MSFSDVVNLLRLLVEVATLVLQNLRTKAHDFNRGMKSKILLDFLTFLQYN